MSRLTCTTSDRRRTSVMHLCAAHSKCINPWFPPVSVAGCRGSFYLSPAQLRAFATASCSSVHSSAANFLLPVSTSALGLLQRLLCLAEGADARPGGCSEVPQRRQDGCRSPRGCLSVRWARWRGRLRRPVRHVLVKKHEAEQSQLSTSSAREEDGALAGRASQENGKSEA